MIDPLDETLDSWMRAQPRTAPAAFTGRVLARVRAERWDAERRFDFGFNIAVAGGALLMVAGLVGLAYFAGFLTVGADVVSLVPASLQLVAATAAPHLETYVTAAIMTATALGLWWWAEHDRWAY